MPDRRPGGKLVSDIAAGFSLHAGVRCDAGRCQGLEHLCRYITRPAIANVGYQSAAAERFVGESFQKNIEAWRKITRLTVRQVRDRLPSSEKGGLNFLYP